MPRAIPSGALGVEMGAKTAIMRPDATTGAYLRTRTDLLYESLFSDPAAEQEATSRQRRRCRNHWSIGANDTATLRALDRIEFCRRVQSKLLVNVSPTARDFI